MFVDRITEVEQQSDLRRALDVLKRRKWLVLRLVVLLPVAAYVVSIQLPKTYEATVVTQVQPFAVDTSLFEPAATAVAQQSAVVDAAGKIAQTPTLAAQADRELTPRADPQTLLNQTSVDVNDTAGFVTIHARDRNPRRSADIANAFATALVTARTTQAREQVQIAVNGVQRQMRDLPAGVSRSQLSSQLQRLRAVEAAQGRNAEILSPAPIPAAPASPQPLRNAALAAVLALLLSAVLAFGLERLDRRIQTGEELEQLTDAPLLGAVPAKVFARRRGVLLPDESFQTIRASLMYFGREHDLKSLVVTSPGQAEGKTTLAINLALSFARSGKEVVLVDADLRRPQIAERLELDTTEGGLSEFLEGELSFGRGFVDVPVEKGRLQVLPAGARPPDPSELLNSERMGRLLEYLPVKGDLVIIDTTPLLPVSDAVPLLSQVSGIVGLARLEQTTVEEVRRFRRIITLSGGRLVGIVPTGGNLDGYGYGYGYGAAASGVRPVEVPRAAADVGG